MGQQIQVLGQQIDPPVAVPTLAVAVRHDMRHVRDTTCDNPCDNDCDTGCVMSLPAVIFGVVLVLWFGNQHAWAIVAALLGALAYTLEIIFFPMGRCGWCDHGKQWSPLTHSFKVCRHCGGAGVRPRLGHRVWKRGG